MTIQHSSKLSEYHTPKKWIETSRSVLEGIDLDPCGSRTSHKYIPDRGGRTFSCGGNWVEWPERSRVFINPPGNCGTDKHGLTLTCKNQSTGQPNRVCSCKLPKQFFDKALLHSGPVVYLAYSVNQIRWALKSLQKVKADMPDRSIMLAFPDKRISYISSVTGKPVRGTPCDSAFMLIHSQLDYAVQDRFQLYFSKAGCTVAKVLETLDDL